MAKVIISRLGKFARGVELKENKINNNVKIIVAMELVIIFLSAGFAQLIFPLYFYFC